MQALNAITIAMGFETLLSVDGWNEDRGGFGDVKPLDGEVNNFKEIVGQLNLKDAQGVDLQEAGMVFENTPSSSGDKNQNAFCSS